MSEYEKPAAGLLVRLHRFLVWQHVWSPVHCGYLVVWSSRTVERPRDEDLTLFGTSADLWSIPRWAQLRSKGLVISPVVGGQYLFLKWDKMSNSSCHIHPQIALKLPKRFKDSTTNCLTPESPEAATRGFTQNGIVFHGGTPLHHRC